jgi:hypothetical protein
MSLATAKHHGQIHVPDGIDSLGTHQNYHTGPLEHNHIDNIKRLGKMTHGQKLVLDWQIPNCRAKSYILDLAYNTMNANAPLTGADDGDDAHLTPPHLYLLRYIRLMSGSICPIHQAQMS